MKKTTRSLLIIVKMMLRKTMISPITINSIGEIIGQDKLTSLTSNF